MYDEAEWEHKQPPNNDGSVNAVAIPRVSGAWLGILLECPMVDGAVGANGSSGSVVRPTVPMAIALGATLEALAVRG